MSRLRIVSPIPSGCGAYALHKQLEQSLDGYRVAPYNPWMTLFPPALLLSGRRMAADIVHTTPDYAPFLSRRDTPLIVTIHHTMLDDFIQHYSSALQRLHYKTDLRWCSQWAMNHADVITAVSQFSADLAKKSLNIQKDIRVINNGIDANVFTPGFSRKEGQRIRVLFTGNLTRRKGAHWLEPIAERLNDGVEIVYTQGLRTTKTRLPEHPKLRCLGNVAYQSLPDLYRQADIFLFPSVREGFGLAVAEAMACGLPAVVTNGSALPELIHHGQGGYLCPVGDVDAFAEKINQLADSPALRLTMGAYNRNRIEQSFSLEKMIAGYRDLFECTI
ncbi:MAG TPA: glycosyltransferase family 1 protein [Gammaproteobacteria bacterium]|nr:glycosyltransferase family 1 protein [Gammaproteobacteria bacterium]